MPTDIPDSSQPPSRAPNKPRPNRKHHKKESDSSQPATSTSTFDGSRRQNAQASLTGTDNVVPTKPQTDRKDPKQQNASNKPSRTGPNSSEKPNQPQGGQGHRKRGAKFKAGLTDPSSTDAASPKPPNDGHKDKKPSKPKGDDLTSTLTYALSTPPYPECPICFTAIHPTQPTWSCSPSRFDRVDEENREENANFQCCWTTFHLKCIQSWAGKSVKALVDAWRARGEERNGEWRCPGCQSRREIIPNDYRCFCGLAAEPKPPRLATPHSCATPCTRPRRGCQHPCPLACHPGPCPPCQVTTQLSCYCGKHIQSIRCANLARGLSCGEVCGRKLGCGNHTCGDVCHPEECKKCEVRDLVRCYCGKVEKEVPCGEGEQKECFVGGENAWTGRFQCDNKCDRLFGCSEHICSKPCHPPSSIPPPCPRSPALVTHCPCGKCALDPSSASAFPPNVVLSRKSCSDPIPTCNSVCMRPLDGCSHMCSTKCHTGSCPPCTIMLVRPCRCGATSIDIQCSSVGSGSDHNNEILCDKACTALRACGRHQCNRLCCPLASLAAAKAKGKGKKRAMLGTAEDDGGLHRCDLVCAKMLGCGSHRCEERDHRGACPPCLRSSFEEMVCYCGRTVLDPPIPCGTRINCTYPCSRPLLPCGHPKMPHSCHEDPTPCPSCPSLTDKLCACGKRTINNVRCSSEKVSCGAKCGKLLGCGFHHCERLCHGDDCGICTSTCGKSRKLCLPFQHLCTLPCHAPSTCSESEPCRTNITLTCACGRIRQSVLCGRSVSSSGRGATQQVKCSNDCLLAKRNARLAEALGINPETKEKPVSYSDGLAAFGRMNVKFLGLVEKSFADFVASERKTQVLPHMPMEKRKFVYELASAYRMDVQMVDQEPHRSVQLIRRIDTRIPSPLLSSTITPSGLGLGKLADLRAPAAESSHPLPPRVTTPVGSSGRGWTSVVASPSLAPNPAPSGSSGSWRTGNPSAHRPLAAAAAAAANAPLPTTVAANSVDVPDNWEDDT